MRAVAVGALIGISWMVATALATGSPRDGAVPAASAQASGELITLATPVGDTRQQLTVIDPRMHVVSVYHIELATGEISLKSVRNIHWDLQMSEFNGVNPLPREIRSLLENK